MDISALHRIGDTAPAAFPAPALDNAAERRDIVRAVRALNRTEMFGQDNELLFQKDRQSERMVLRIVNRKTKEVVAQIPPEHVLSLVRGMNAGGA